jgi:hypothetical protein
MLKPSHEKRRLKNNPWEILVVGALFFFPGLFMLFHRGPLIAAQQVYRYSYLMPGGVTVISEHGAHVFACLAIGVGVIFFWFYFYLRRLILRSTPHIVEHGHDI